MVDLSGKKAHIYSVILEGEDKTLLEEFFDSNSLYEDELEEILYKIISLGKDTGCRRQFFKMNEGKPGDGVARLLIPKGRLRLYCLYFEQHGCVFRIRGIQAGNNTCLSRRRGPKLQGYTNDRDRKENQQGYSR